MSSLSAASRFSRLLSRRGLSAQAASSEELMALEREFGCRNYDPLPAVLCKGRGAEVWDVEGRRYLDFLAAYGAVNQGHCHPRIVKALTDQAQQLGLCSRAFYNDKLGRFERRAAEMFGYDKVLPMNTGVEGGESAVKLARRWGYERKRIPENEAVVVFAANNFWGRTLAAVSSSTDPTSYRGFGPFMPGFKIVPFDDLGALEQAVTHPNVAAFMVEPIQGEAGVVVPKTEQYLRRAKQICEKHDVLLIADEVQSGLGRCGAMLASQLDGGCRPDLVVLGKALSGGTYPVSAVLADAEVMDCIRPGEHGSTYGGNPTACAVALEALEVLRDEKMCERSEEMGEAFRRGAEALAGRAAGRVREVRGRGLMNAVEIEETESFTASKVCLRLKQNGVLAKPTHGNIIRFTPPLVVTHEQVETCLRALERSMREVEEG